MREAAFGRPLLLILGRSHFFNAALGRGPFPRGGSESACIQAHTITESQEVRSSPGGDVGTFAARWMLHDFSDVRQTAAKSDVRRRICGKAASDALAH